MWPGEPLGTPLRDVVIVTHNSADHLGAALTGLAPDEQVVVVDNASTDASADLAEAAGALVCRATVNDGFAASANRGARFGTAEFILFLNPDASIGPDDLDRLTAAMAAEPGLAAVTPRLRRPDGTEQRSTWPIPSPAHAWEEALGLHRLRRWGSTRRPGGAAAPGTTAAARPGAPNRSGRRLPGRARPDRPTFVVGACLLVRRRAFEHLHGFDERFWLYGEETDLCLRAIAAGWSVRQVPEAWAVHVGGASGADHAPLVFEHFSRGIEHLARKHWGSTGLASVRTATAVSSVLRAVAPGDAARRRFHLARLGRLARMAVVAPLSVRLDSPATRAAGNGLVVCSLEAWDDVWRRNQFLVRELLAADPERRVLFVEPPFDWPLELRRRAGRRRQRGLRPTEDDGRVVRFEPFKVWPNRAGPMADRSLHRQVRLAALRLGLDQPVLWVNHAGYAGLGPEARWPTLYDVTDDWTRGGGGARSQQRVADLEARLFGESGAVVVCSEGLAATRRAQRPDLRVVPNAVDVGHFRRPRDRPDDLPPGPVAVYVGSLHEDRIDVDLVVDVARAHPDLALALIGPDALSPSTRARLEAVPGLRLLGPRPYGDVPAYVQHADVVVVPHVVSPFTESLDPIKAYECLAAGRPTVATPVAGFRGLGPPVEVADRNRFAEAVRRALTSPVPPPPGRPVPSWADRAVDFRAALDAARSHPLPPVEVVYVDHCARLSGGELALVRMLPALDGVAPRVVLGEDGPLRPRLEASGVAVEVLPLDPAMANTRRHEVTAGALGARRATAAAGATIALRRRLRQLAPDLVHTNSLKSALYGGLAGRLAGVPVVWHVRDRIADDYLPPAAARAVRLLAWALPSLVITNSNATRSSLGRLPRVGVIPSPVVYDAVEDIAGGDADVHRPFTAAMVGRLAAWKGQHVFLEAFASAFPSGPERALVVGSAMFGEDGYEAELRRLVARLGLEGRVTFTGFVEDVGSVLADAHCLVHASVIPEPFGQVVVEGMAAGLPVLASEGGGPTEVITHGVDGLLHRPGDVGALADDLRRVAADPGLRQRLGGAGALRARDFTPEVVARQVEAAYRTVIARTGLWRRRRRAGDVAGTGPAHRRAPGRCPSSTDDRGPACASP